VTMSTLSPKGRALVRAGRRALQPTEADRVRILGALSFQLETLPCCRSAWDRSRPRPLRSVSHWRRRALSAGPVGTQAPLPITPLLAAYRRTPHSSAGARGERKDILKFPYQRSWRSRLWPGGRTH
jgi:hypothetical protein